MSGINIKQEHEKDIVVLNQFEAIRKKPNIYMGNVKLGEDKLALIINDSIISKEVVWSQGLMQMLIEIFENALDEAKRCKGSMKTVTVKVNFDTNMVSVKDSGGGFRNAEKIHPKTNKSIVRTALEELHAGSNFADNDKNILGTHGVGSACVNILSKMFSVKTQNDTHFVSYVWDDFKVIDEIVEERVGDMGTEISFIPSTDVFGEAKWDEDIVSTYLSFKQMLIKKDLVINNLQIKVVYVKDGIASNIKLSTDFIPECIEVETKMGHILLWKKIENGTTVGFVNGSNCIGPHVNIVKDWLNDAFDYNLSHHFYDFMFILNVPSKQMLFSDQNKTKYAINRQEIEPTLVKEFKKKLISNVIKSSIYKDIKEDIEKRLYNDNMKKIRSAQKTSKKKISDKYHAASKNKDYLFLTEGNCMHEETLISTINSDGDILYKSLSDVKVGDNVITHENNIREVLYKTESIKKNVVIKTKIGNINTSEQHRLFVYDTESKEFYFEHVKNLIKGKHKLVKNKLSLYKEKFVVESVNTLDDYHIEMFSNTKRYVVTKTDKICKVDYDNQKFKMIDVCDINIGDILCMFDF